MKTQALRLTRLAAAAAFAAAFSVQAADFSVYGIVDTGIIVEHNKMGSQPSSTSAREEFGVNLGPRIGLTGTEDLGNGTKVKMLLENLFESDDGEMLFSRLWGGEASLALEGSMGEIAVGRMGALVSPFGHWGIFGMQATPFGFGWGRSGGMHWMVGGDRLDNTIMLRRPSPAACSSLHSIPSKRAPMRIPVLKKARSVTIPAALLRPFAGRGSRSPLSVFSTAS